MYRAAREFFVSKFDPLTRGVICTYVEPAADYIHTQKEIIYLRDRHDLSDVPAGSDLLPFCEIANTEGLCTELLVVEMLSV